jgi:hypothetical protein
LTTAIPAWLTIVYFGELVNGVFEHYGTLDYDVTLCKIAASFNICVNNDLIVGYRASIDYNGNFVHHDETISSMTKK